MNIDPLENELAAMKPLPLSDGFMPRFEEALHAQRSVRGNASRWRLRVAVGVAIAACIVMAAIAFHRAVPLQVNRIVPPLPIVHTQVLPFPTVAQYQRAYMESPAALEALLQQRSPNAREQPMVRADDMTHFDLN